MSDQIKCAVVVQHVPKAIKRLKGCLLHLPHERSGFIVRGPAYARSDARGHSGEGRDRLPEMEKTRVKAAKAR
eukprot:10819726-Heterocapsa_arctica.AAC.1